jgi:ANTAR domain-containing protein
VIEQAKGIIAEREGLAVDQVFAQRRSYARNHNRLADLARAVVVGTVGSTSLDSPER